VLTILDFLLGGVTPDLATRISDIADSFPLWSKTTHAELSQTT